MFALIKSSVHGVYSARVQHKKTTNVFFHEDVKQTTHVDKCEYESGLLV